MVIANGELVFQKWEKEKGAAELAIANKELLFQNGEKEKRAAELVRRWGLMYYRIAAVLQSYSPRLTEDDLAPAG